MARSSTISSKGQITVPLEIRNRLGLKKGDRVEFVVASPVSMRQMRGCARCVTKKVEQR